MGGGGQFCKKNKIHNNRQAKNSTATELKGLEIKTSKFAKDYTTTEQKELLYNQYLGLHIFLSENTN